MKILRNKADKKVAVVAKDIILKDDKFYTDGVQHLYNKDEYEIVESNLATPQFYNCYTYDSTWEVWDTERLQELTLEKLIADMEKQRVILEEALHSHLDKQCVALGFRGDNLTRPYRSLANYTAFPDSRYYADAMLLGAWCSACMEKSEDIEKEVLAQTRPIPSVDEYLGELPMFVYPEDETV